MDTLAVQINRRVGRMEALASDLAGLKPDYKPTELEMMRALELQAVLARVFDADPGPPQAKAPEAPAAADPAPEVAADPAEKAKKTKK